jgi:hypothetical protein
MPDERGYPGLSRQLFRGREPFGRGGSNNISLLQLPPRAPELNGQENIWQSRHPFVLNWSGPHGTSKPHTLVM